MRISRRHLLKVAGICAFLPDLTLGRRSVWGQNTERTPKAYAMVIGVNNVDPAAYSRIGMRAPPLYVCGEDARLYYQILKSRLGKALKMAPPILDKMATRDTVRQHICWAAHDLQPGDTFFITFSGHGGQIPTPPEAGEPDRKDETWCLYDGQLIDDELYLMWSYFRAGVRIVLISDSCNSGTIAKAMIGLETMQSERKVIAELFPERSPVVDAIQDEQGNVRTAARILDVTRTRGKLPRSRQVDDFAAQSAATRDLVHNQDRAGVRLRALPEDMHQDAYLAKQELYDELARTIPGEDVLARAGAGTTTMPKGLLLAGCQDGGQSWEASGPDGRGNGMFTAAIERAMRSNPRSYRELFKLATQLTTSNQTPNFYPFGDESDESFYASLAPFMMS